MSTSGVFIIRKGGNEKAMDIRHDAYPNGTGADIVDLVKTTNLHALFDGMTVFDEWNLPDMADGTFPDEPESFSYEGCRICVNKKARLWVSPETTDKIRNSLFCEYAYVIDLDAERLSFFVGSQTLPQEGSPYGTEAVTNPYVPGAVYYPCRLAAVFPFSYVRQASTEHVVDRMEKAEKAHSDNAADACFYLPQDLTSSEKVQQDYSREMEKIIAAVFQLDERLKSVHTQLQDIHPVCMNRVRTLVRDISHIHSAVEVMERRIEAYW